MFAALKTAVHLDDSAVTKSWNSAGVLPTGSIPCARICDRTSSRARILRVSLGGASGSLAVEFPLAVDGVVRVRGKRMPVAWLQSLLATQWADGRLTSGTLDADLAIRARDAGGSEMVGPVVFDDLGLDSVDGRIAAAGLDVFEGEPQVHPGLLKVPNVLLTPHIASATRGTRLAMANLAADNLIAFFDGRGPLSPVNNPVRQ